MLVVLPRDADRVAREQSSGVFTRTSVASRVSYANGRHYYSYTMNRIATRIGVSIHTKTSILRHEKGDIDTEGERDGFPTCSARVRERERGRLMNTKPLLPCVRGPRRSSRVMRVQTRKKYSDRRDTEDLLPMQTEDGEKSATVL